MGLSQLAHPCAGCLAASLPEELGQAGRGGKAVPAGNRGNNGGPQVYDPSGAGS